MSSAAAAAGSTCTCLAAASCTSTLSLTISRPPTPSSTSRWLILTRLWMSWPAAACVSSITAAKCPPTTRASPAAWPKTAARTSPGLKTRPATSWPCSRRPPERYAARVHRDPRRPREQPERRDLAPAQAQDHHLHRRLGLGQVVGGLRHHRQRSPAAAVRELQHVRAQLLAALSPARRRLHSEPEHGGDRGPKAPERRGALHRRHHHRHRASAAPALLAGRPALRGPGQCLLVQPCAGHVPGMRRRRPQDRHRPEILIDRTRSLSQGAVVAPGFAGWERDNALRSGLFDNDKKLSEYSANELDRLLYSEPRPYKLAVGNKQINTTFEGLVPRFNR